MTDHGVSWSQGCVRSLGIFPGKLHQLLKPDFSAIIKINREIYKESYD